MAYKLGTKVRQVVPVIQGTVADVRYDAAEQRFYYLINFVLDGGEHQRWFGENEVTEITEGAAQ